MMKVPREIAHPFRIRAVLYPALIWSRTRDVCMYVCMYVCMHAKFTKSGLNPSNPKGDQLQSSHCNISALKNRVVTRITNRIRQHEFA